MTDSNGSIFDIKKYAVHDGPGIRTTVFLKGCPLRCAWCHNPESWRTERELMVRPVSCVRCGRCVAACPSDAAALVHGAPVTNPARCTRCDTCLTVCPASARQMVGRTISVDEVIAEIEKDRIFYDTSGGGVTVSGGEPLMQPDFLEALLIACRARDVHTAVDTCCYGAPALIRQIAELADLFLCDLKHLNSDKHKQLTGVENGLILDNITLLASLGKAVVIRVPVVRGFNDDPEAIENIGLFVRGLSTVGRIDLLPYHSGGSDKARRLGHAADVLPRKSVSPQTVAALAEQLQTMGFDVKVGG